MIDYESFRLLINCLVTIEQNLQTKEKFLASYPLQDKVLSGLQEFSDLSICLAWGCSEPVTIDALYRINNLVFQQLLIPGVTDVNLVKVWQVASECLPIIKREVSQWADSNVDLEV